MPERTVKLGRVIAERAMRVATDAFVRYFERHKEMTYPVDQLHGVVGASLERRLPEAIADAQAALDQGQGSDVALAKFEAVCVLAGVEAATDIARPRNPMQNPLDRCIAIRVSALGSAVGRIDN